MSDDWTVRDTLVKLRRLAINLEMAGMLCEAFSLNNRGSRRRVGDPRVAHWWPGCGRPAPNRKGCIIGRTERCAADLSDEELERIALVRAEIKEMGMNALLHMQRRDPTFRFRSRDHEDEVEQSMTSACLAVLDKLLAKGEGR